jgi:hypothetical protein
MNVGNGKALPPKYQIANFAPKSHLLGVLKFLTHHF